MYPYNQPYQNINPNQFRQNPGFMMNTMQPNMPTSFQPNPMFNQFGQPPYQMNQMNSMPSDMSYPSNTPGYIPNQIQQPPPKKRLIVKLENKERGFYSSKLSELDPADTGRVDASVVAPFLKKSGLSKEVLRNIWLIAASNEKFLDKEEFYVALRLVAYAQNNIEVSADSIIKNISAPLPKFDYVQKVEEKPPVLQQPNNPNLGMTQPTQNLMMLGPNIQMGGAMGVGGNLSNSTTMTTSGNTLELNTQDPCLEKKQPTFEQPDYLPDDKVLDLTPELVKAYETIFENIDRQKKGLLTQNEAKETFGKSGLPTQILFQIWQLADSGERGYLDRSEFILALHMIAMAKRNIPVPKTIPRKLDKYLKDYRRKQPSKDYLITKFLESQQPPPQEIIQQPQTTPLDNFPLSRPSEEIKIQENYSSLRGNNLEQIDLLDTKPTEVIASGFDGNNSSNTFPSTVALRDQVYPALDHQIQSTTIPTQDIGYQNDQMHVMQGSTHEVMDDGYPAGEDPQELNMLLDQCYSVLSQLNLENRDFEMQIQDVEQRKNEIILSIQQVQKEINIEFTKNYALQSELSDKINNIPISLDQVSASHNSSRGNESKWMNFENSFVNNQGMGKADHGLFGNF